MIYVVPAYPWDITGTAVPGAAAPTAAAVAPAAQPDGTITFDVEPRSGAEIHVDGYFVGTTDDRTGGLTLEPGPHRVDLVADGYEPEHVDVRVEPGAAVTLRRVLQPVKAAVPAAQAAPAARPAPAPIVRKPFYFIAGCYLGDVPPEKAGLPASCDLTKTVVVRP